MAATKTKEKDDFVRRAKKRAFWYGVAEGFGGPALMGYDLRVPSPRCLAIEVKTLASGVVSAREMGNALERAAEQVMEKRGLASFIVRQKRLDGSGKMRDEDVFVVAPKRAAYGESQE